jgi:DNA-binding HxlR family transcriptional regulator
MRSYDDPCGVARALDAVGERWALLVVRDLLLGPKRFTDLAAGLPGMSQNVLAQRLRDLEEQGVVARRVLGPPSGARVYELTDAGYELEDVVLALARWGSRAPLVDRATLTADALALALRTTFDAAAAGELRARVELHMGADRFAAEITEGRFRVVRGEHVDPDAVLTVDAGVLQGIVFGGAAVPAGAVAGDRELAERFVRVFPRPAPRVASARGPRSRS